MNLDPMKFLPPGVKPFEVLLHPGGQMDIRGLEEEAEAWQVVQALQQTPLAEPREDTALWRVRGLLIQQQAQLYEYAVSDSGSDEEGSWEVRPFPEMPGVPVQGDSDALNTFDALHYREGRIDLEPEAPDDLLEALESAVQAYHGTEQTWAAQHQAAGGAAGEVPEARRVRLKLQDDGAGLHFVTQPETAEYLLGGAWHPYGASALPLVEAATETDDAASGNPFDLLSSLFDMQSVQAEVYADGNVELKAEEVNEAAGEIIKFTLRDLLGAGDETEWKQKVGELFSLGDTDERPQALRVSLLKQMIDADPNLAGQAMQPVAISYDGQTWLELDAEEDEDEE